MHQLKLYPYQGQMISIPSFCKETGKSKSNVYEQIRKGRTLDDIALGIVPKRHTNNRTPITYLWKGSLKTIKEIATLEKIDASNLYRRLQNGEDIVTAIARIKASQPKLFPYQGRLVSRKTILKENPDLSKEKLYILLSDADEYSEEEVLDILALCPRKDYYQYEGMSLYRYCLLKQYNYTTIYYLIKRKGYSIEEAIQEYLLFGQGDPKKGHYFVGDILLSHFCIMESLPISYIIYYLEKGFSFEEALKKCIFNSGESIINKTRRQFLCDIYDVWAKDEEKNAYNLSNDDVAFLKLCQERLQKALRDYELLQLAYHLDTSQIDDNVLAFLTNNALSHKDALHLLDKIYGQFETTTSSSVVKYKWHKTSLDN